MRPVARRAAARRARSSSARGLGLRAGVRAEHLDRERPPAALISRLAASSSGAAGAHSCHARDQRARVDRARQLERGHRRRGHGARAQRRHDAEARAARAPQRPEQVRLALLVAVDDAAVGEHDLGARAARRRSARAGGRGSRARRPASGPRCRRRAAPGGDRQRRARRARRRRRRAARPRRSSPARPPTATPSIGETSITTPSVDERPAKQCPPLRTASGSPAPSAKASAAATSCGPAQRRPPRAGCLGSGRSPVASAD